MAGMLKVNADTFTTAICMGVMPREVFGQPGVQEKNAAGIAKWTAQVAVTYAPDGTGITPPTEVLNITLTTNDNPGGMLPAGTPVVFEELRAGLTAPEQRADGKGIRGGRLYWSAAAIKPAFAPNGRRPAENAA